MILPRVSTVTALVRTFSNWPACAFRAAAAFYLQKSNADIVWRTRRGTVLRSPAGDQSWWAVIETFALDEYELKTNRFGNDGTFFVDVGANVGAFALAFLEAYPSARGVCIEPGQRAFSYFEKNIAANNKCDAVQAINAAAVGSSDIKSVRFFEKPSATGGSTTVESCTNDENEPGSWSNVPAVALSDVLREIRGPVSLVKIDIEGGEYDLILNSPRHTWRNVQNIVAEYHPVPGRSFEELVAALTGSGLALRRHERMKNDGFGVLWFERR